MSKKQRKRKAYVCLAPTCLWQGGCREGAGSLSVMFLNSCWDSSNAALGRGGGITQWASEKLPKGVTLTWGRSEACQRPKDLLSEDPLSGSRQAAFSNQFSLVAQSCPTLCDPMNCSTPGLPVHHQLPEFTQTHVHWVSDAIQPSHPLSSTSLPAPNPSQHQSLLQWVNSLHEVAKVLEFQL